MKRYKPCQQCRKQRLQTVPGSAENKGYKQCWPEQKIKVTNSVSEQKTNVTNSDWQSRKQRLQTVSGRAENKGYKQ